jgi:wobble nucleotide-excising tRNase
MAITKIIKIENIGRLSTLTSVGNVQFRKLNLVYGPNAHGKTTLAALLRSLKTGNAEYIQERAMVGRTQEPRAEVRISSGNATFGGTGWNRTAPEIEIFDGAYVSDNVYTGEHVDQEHRKNLYEVVVGAKAVALAREVDRLDADGRNVAKEISATEKKLAAHIQAPFPVEEFLTLEPESGLEEKIAAATTRLNALRKSQQILKRPELETIRLPEVPARVLEALNAGPEKVSAEVERQVREHLRIRLGGRGEQWLAQGLEFLHDDRCPFCAQDTSQVALIPLFRTFFSEAYREQGVAAQSALNELLAVLGEEALSRVQRLVQENDARIRVWEDLIDLSAAAYSTNLLESRWRNVRDVLRARLEARLANPTAPEDGVSKRVAALRDFAAAAEEVKEINERIRKANAGVGAIKKESATANEGEVELLLRRLRNMQIRQKPEVVALCEGLLAARQKKKDLEEGKKAKREELERLAVGVLLQYEEAINALLTKFGANFTITGTKPSFQGGKASSTYQIAINNEKVDLGDSSTRGIPCFRTALSAGDKSTLALAFFLATLHRDPDLGTKTIVFDDPLSSLDVFRTAQTQQEISRLVDKAEQVVVLSHDHLFVKRLFDQCDPATTLVAQLARSGAGLEVREFDVQQHCLGGAHQDYFVLRAFLENGSSTPSELRSVCRSIRPYLEGQLRFQFPEQFKAGKWLGDFIGMIRNATTLPLAALKPRLDELEAINDYSKGLHHAGDPSLDPVPDPTELAAFVTRTIAFGQGV